MKIVFVHRSHESLGLSYLSAQLKAKNHQVDLVFDMSLFDDDVFQLRKKRNNYRKLALEAVKKKPDLIGFSVVTSDYNWAVNVASAIKKIRDVPIIFGGIHSSTSSNEVIQRDCVDIVSIGEADVSLCNLADKWDEYLEKKYLEIDGFWFKTENSEIIQNSWPKLPDLDSLAFPDIELFSKTPCTGHRYVIAASRGCNRCCSYCYNSFAHKTYGNKFKRRRSVKNVIEELKYAKTSRSIKIVWFLDDNLIDDENWIIEFCIEYSKKIRIPFFCIIHANEVNPTIAKYLSIAGCYAVQIGVQTLNRDLSKKVLHRSLNIDKIRQACTYLKDQKIKIIVDHIVGIPGETKEDFNNAFEFYNTIRPNLINVNHLTLYPGTDLLKMDCIKKSEFFNQDCNTFLILSQPVINSLQVNFSFFMYILPLFPQRFVSFLHQKIIVGKKRPVFDMKYFLLFLRVFNSFRWGDPLTKYHFYRYFKGILFILKKSVVSYN